MAPFFNASFEMSERRVVSVVHVRSVIAEFAVPSDPADIYGARIDTNPRDRYAKF
ncbi:hypothetical protein AB0D87_45595 [Streptomyces sp. NPDC048342]|uniref:hypothetical protein n=1 Tax=unclassified Streptomyces TaxID=2593676 RepID=UPI00344AF24C